MQLHILLNLALDLARRLSQKTVTRVDDELIDLLEALHDDPTLRAWIGGKLLQPPGTLAIETAPSAAVAAALAQRQLTWNKLMAYLPRILEILHLVRTFTAS